jgi:hypothetical protein
MMRLSNTDCDEPDGRWAYQYPQRPSFQINISRILGLSLGDRELRPANLLPSCSRSKRSCHRFSGCSGQFEYRPDFQSVADLLGKVIKRQAGPFPLDFPPAWNLVHAGTPVQNDPGCPKSSG